MTVTRSSKIIANKSIAVDKLADGVDGQLITWDAAGVAATVSAGAADQVLTSNGAGAAPEFKAAGGGGGGMWELVAHNTFTADNTSITGLDGNTDRIYKLLVTANLASDNFTFELRFNGDTANNYYWAMQTGGYEGGDVNVTTDANSADSIIFGAGGEDKIAIMEATISAVSGVPRVVNCSKAGTISSSKYYSRTGSGIWNNTADNMVSVQLVPGKTLDAGEYWLYKIVSS